MCPEAVCVRPPGCAQAQPTSVPRGCLPSAPGKGPLPLALGFSFHLYTALKVSPSLKPALPIYTVQLSRTFQKGGRLGKKQKAPQ